MFKQSRTQLRKIPQNKNQMKDHDLLYILTKPVSACIKQSLCTIALLKYRTELCLNETENFSWRTLEYYLLVFSKLCFPH